MLSKYDEIRARRARGDEGFSLIELLVVVVIMGILIAIAVPVYLNYQNGAKKKSVEADVRNAIPAVEQCLSDNGGAWVESCAFDSSAEGSAAKNYIRVSAGNTLTVTGATGGYTITGDNSDTKYNVVYDSSNGTTTKTTTS